MHKVYGDDTREVWEGGPETRCESCGVKFSVVIIYELRPDAGEDCFFRCPHCGHAYFSAYVAAEGVAVRKQVNVHMAAGEKAEGEELLGNFTSYVERLPPEGLDVWRAAHD